MSRKVNFGFTDEEALDLFPEGATYIGVLSKSTKGDNEYVFYVDEIIRSAVRAKHHSDTVRVLMPKIYAADKELVMRALKYDFGLEKEDYEIKIL